MLENVVDFVLARRVIDLRVNSENVVLNFLEVRFFGPYPTSTMLRYILMYVMYIHSGTLNPVILF